MIKIDGDNYYLSAGEACYVFRYERGALRHMYFGKRIEPEDDIIGLGGTASEPELAVFCDGKTAPEQLEPVSAEILPQKPSGGASLFGGKTLKLTLKAGHGALVVTLYYTPYPRGGFTRRVTVENLGTSKTALEIVQRVPRNGQAVPTAAVGGMNNFVFSAANGDAYGFLCPYVDGAVESSRVVECSSGVIRAEKGQTVVSPELLIVYSDNGLGGMSRVFHDVLRESMNGGTLFRRSAAVLFLPKMPCDRACKAVRSACELGFDAVAVDYGMPKNELGRIAETAKELGIAPGLRVDGKDVAAFGSIEEIVDVLKNTVAINEIGYVMLGVPTSEDPHEAAKRLFEIRRRLTAVFADLKIDCGVMTEDKRRGLDMCYPLVTVRNIIATAPRETFKQRFDCATLGALGYEFDPTATDDGLLRAVRAQILSYQDDAPTVMFGDVYDLESSDSGSTCRMAVSKDKSTAYAVCVVKSAARVKLCGLDEHNLYHVREIGKTFSGAALAHLGVTLPEPVGKECSFTLHLRQVADYE